jgi:hypothetical protein
MKVWLSLHFDLAIVAAVLAARVCSEPRNYAEQFCWVSSGWMVAFGPCAASCPPRWRLSRPASRG